MIALRHRVDIDRPVADVFDFVANVENAPKWQPAVIETKRITPDPIGLGSQFREVAKMLGRRVTTLCEITEFVPGKRLSFAATSTGPFSYATTYTFETTGATTRLGIDGTFRLSGIWRLLEPLVKREVRNESAGELKAMKAAIESRPRRTTHTGA
jgi:uncharacterized protein YndB with AHSA1/START domain